MLVHVALRPLDICAFHMCTAVNLDHWQWFQGLLLNITLAFRKFTLLGFGNNCARKLVFARSCIKFILYIVPLFSSQSFVSRFPGLITANVELAVHVLIDYRVWTCLGVSGYPIKMLSCSFKCNFGSSLLLHKWSHLHEYSSIIQSQFRIFSELQFHMFSDTLFHMVPDLLYQPVLDTVQLHHLQIFRMS